MQTLLFDFYGELLTERQRQIYEDVVCNDLSLSEAAQDYGVTRQGIHDLVKRADRQLEEYESRLHMVEKTRKLKSLAEKIQALAQEEDGENGEDAAGRLSQIRELSAGLLEEL